jgi:ABC-2 type transport system permease protein
VTRSTADGTVTTEDGPAKTDGGTVTAENGPATATTAADTGLAGLPTLLYWVLYKRFLLLVRYPVNTLAQFVSVYMFFAVVFFGGQAAVSGVQSGGAAALAGTFDGLIVGWFLWTMSLTAYFSLVMTATNEAQWGTLEQLYMSPYGFGTVMLCQVVAFVLESLAWGGGILALMLLTTGRTLTVDLVTVVPISLLALMSVVGISFVFGGLAILYKRIENVSQLVQFVLIGLIAAPISSFEPLRYLPLVQGSAMLQEAMQDGVGLTQFSTLDLGILVGTGVGYFLLGYLLFNYAGRVARSRGVLGHY